MTPHLRGHVRFGVGALATLPELVRQAGGERVFVVSDPGVVRSGVAAQVVEVLEADRLATHLFDAIEPNPGTATVIRGSVELVEFGLEGTVVVPNIVLNGTVKGDVAAAGRVELGAKARVVGNVRYGLIEMAIGAEVNGKLIHASEAAAGSSSGKEAAAIARVASVNRIGEGS